MTKEEFIEHCIYNTKEQIEEYIKKEEEFAKRYNVEPMYYNSGTQCEFWEDPFEDRIIETNAKKEKIPIRDFVLLARKNEYPDDEIESIIVDYNGTLDCKDISISAIEDVKHAKIKPILDIDFFFGPQKR